MKILRLNFIPLNKDLGLLLLRISFGILMIVQHGWNKLINFNEQFHSFSDPLGISSEASYILVTFFETFGALGIIIGFYTRLNALGLTIVMAVAFFFAQNSKVIGNTSGELTLIYGFGFLLLLLNGAGKYALDRRIGVRS